MTYNDIVSIAKRLDKETKERIDEGVEERMEILSKGKLTREELMKMEECLYMSLVIQEYLNSEAELLEEERDLLLLEMEEMYNEYGELLSRAKLEEKLSRKKRMALELKRIREELFNRKNRVKRVKNQLQENQDSQETLKKVSSVENMEEIVKSKKDLSNPDKGLKFGLGGGRIDGENQTANKKGLIDSNTLNENDVERIARKKIDEAIEREREKNITQEQFQERQDSFGADPGDLYNQTVDVITNTSETTNVNKLGTDTLGAAYLVDAYKEMQNNK